MVDFVPVYIQIKEAIKRWIVDGDYKPSQKIPSESELLKTFKVSRLTIRQALGQLIQEGYLISEKGRGYFVSISQENLKVFSNKICCSIEDLYYHVMKMKPKYINIEKIITPLNLSQKLELKPEDKHIYEVMRVRYIDDKPIAITKSYLKLEYGNILTKEKLKKNNIIMMIIEKELGIIWRNVVQSIEATFASNALANQLNIATGSPMLRVERLLMAAKHRPIIFAISWFRGDMFKYNVQFRVVHKNGDPKLIYEGIEKDVYKYI